MPSRMWRPESGIVTIRKPAESRAYLSTTEGKLLTLLTVSSETRAALALSVERPEHRTPACTRADPAALQAANASWIADRNK
jgi:hypothetical protein